MDLIKFNVGSFYEAVWYDRYYHTYKRMYEAISKSTCTITFKDVESQDIITYKLRNDYDSFRNAEIAYPYGADSDSPIIYATHKISLTFFMDNKVALKTYKAYDLNGENSCFVHTGSNSFVLHCSDCLNQLNDQYILITNVESYLDASTFLMFMENGYIDIWYGYSLDAFIWIKQNGLPVSIESENEYLKSKNLLAS
jgi:hypothetical protein